MTYYWCSVCKEIGETNPCICGSEVMLTVGAVKVHPNTPDLSEIRYSGYNEKDELMGIEHSADTTNLMDRRVALMDTMNAMIRQGYTAALPTTLEEYKE